MINSIITSVFAIAGPEIRPMNNASGYVEKSVNRSRILKLPASHGSESKGSRYSLTHSYYLFQ